MPYRPPSVCIEPGCLNYAIPGKTRCREHHKERKQNRNQWRGSAASRGYDSKWAKFAKWYLRQHPICEECGRESRVPHHIIPLDQGGDKYDENNQIIITTKSEEILNNLTNRKLLLDILGDQSFAFNKSIVDKIKLTTVTSEFLRKVDILGFDENEKKEFLREMLALSPKEREEIFSNILSRESVKTEQSSKDIIKNLVNKDLILQIFDENITDKRRNLLEKIELTTVSVKFLNKVDALGLKGNNKINFIREMLALSPKEREEIINNILNKKANKNS